MSSPSAPEAGSEPILSWYMDVQETIIPPPVVRKDGDDPLALAQYLKDDLMALREYTIPLDPIAWLNLFRLQGEYPLDPEYIIELIADDVGMMIRDQLITSVHVIFAHPVPDDTPFQFHFENAYHVRYLTMEPEYGLSKQQGPLKANGNLPQQEIVGSTYFMVAVTWIPGLTRNRKSSVRRHRFLFDWVAFDGAEALMTIRRVLRGQINPDLIEPAEPTIGPDTPITT